MTDFAKRVYAAVLKIPLGQVRSYKWVARQAGRPRAYRATGQVLKNNPYPLVIPCHRVVNSDRSPGGYIFGGRAKRSLLELEKNIKRCIENKN